MQTTENQITLRVGDTIWNTVGLRLFVKHIDGSRKIAYLSNEHNEMNPYKVERIIENIMSGKWKHEPLRKYANWI